MVCLTSHRTAEPKPCTHHAHRGFGEAIGAEFASLSIPSWLDMPAMLPGHVARGLTVPDGLHGVVLFEFADLLHAAPVIRRRQPDARILLLATHLVFPDHLLSNGYGGGPKGRLRLVHNRTQRRIVHEMIRRYVDGCVAVSPFVADYLRTRFPGLPVTVALPYVEDQFHERLTRCSPSYGDDHAVTVGRGAAHKGVDLLVDAWPTVREHHETATLAVVGRGHPDDYERVPGVSVTGFVEDLAGAYEAASLYVHPARVDAFGVTITEAMAACVPPLVTATTGGRMVVEEVGEEFVCEPSADQLAERVIAYFDRDVDDRRRLGAVSRALAREYTGQVRRAAFVRAFDALLDRVPSGSR